MKKLLLILIFPFLAHSQTTFKNELLGPTNIIHIGNRGYIEKDKFLHGTAGAWVGSSVYMYSYYKTDRILLSAAISILSAFFVGEAKELYDRANGGKFSNADLIETTKGGFSGVFTKVIQIDIQQNNKIISEEEKEKYQNLNQPHDN